MSLLLATQITAVATAVLAAFAFVTALFAFLAFRKQSAEVKLLQEQAGRDVEQRRRAQAVKVYIVTGGRSPTSDDTVRMSNTSEQPIYDLAAGADGHEPVRLQNLLPGEAYAFSAAWMDAALNMPTVWLDFRDAAGQQWRTTSRGELTPR